MVTYTFTNGTVADADEVNQNFEDVTTIAADIYKQTGMNHIRMLIDRSLVYSADQNDGYGEAYIDSDGRNNSVDTTDTTALFDTDKYKTGLISAPYVQIEATSISSISDFAINNCAIVETGSGVWTLYCTTGTDAVKRAQIYKTLFYGTDGSNPRASSTYLTGVTAMKTTISRDVGKRGIYAEGLGGQPEDTSNQYDGTFSDTTNNTACSSWSYVYAGGTTVDETGTDTESDETDNPSDCRLRSFINSGGNDNGRWELPIGTVLNNATNSFPNDADVKVYMLVYGSVSFSVTNGSWTTTNNTDFLSDNSIPAFTATSGSGDINYPVEVVHDIPTGTFSSTISSAFLTTIVEDWEDGAAIAYKLTNATEDTGWLDANEISTFTAFTSEPTEYRVRLTPTSTSPTTGYPSINGSWVRAR